MSYFNADQESYMRYLDSISPEKKCWCGWYGIGQCLNCKTTRTCADKLAERCTECGNDGGPEKKTITHIITCSRAIKEKI